MKKIHWGICDDNEYICFIYQTELSKYEYLEFSGDIHCAKDCLDFCAKHPIDILLLDIQLENETAGINIIPKIKKLFPMIKIIILTSYEDEEYIFSAFANGADDYFLKTLPIEQLSVKIQSVYDNTSSLSPNIAQTLSKKAKEISDYQKSLLYTLKIMTSLSTSEFEVLKLVCKGYSYKEISTYRYVDLGTVKAQASKILKKFDTHNMKQLAESLNKQKIFDLFD